MSIIKQAPDNNAPSLYNTISVAVQTGIPTLIWGEPGVGKTSFIRALGRALELPTEVVIASIREPSDFAGLPVVRDSGVDLAPPRWAQRLAQAGKGICFLDELACAPPAVQAALLRVVFERVVGDLPLPPTVYIVAASNPPEQAASGWDLAAPLANRFLHITWRTESNNWITGMTGAWNLPPLALLPAQWQRLIPAHRALMAGFIQARPNLLLQVPQNSSNAGHAWPSPRTWDMAATASAAAEAAALHPDNSTTLIAGCIGEGAALEFKQWQKTLDLPNPEAVLANPSSFKMPKRDDQTFAVLSSIIAAAVSQLTPERWQAAWEVLEIASKHGKTDVAAIAAKALAQARQSNLPAPRTIREFVPILQAAGLIR